MGCEAKSPHGLGLAGFFVADCSLLSKASTKLRELGRSQPRQIDRVIDPHS